MTMTIGIWKNEDKMRAIEIAGDRITLAYGAAGFEAFGTVSNAKALLNGHSTTYLREYQVTSREQALEIINRFNASATKAGYTRIGRWEQNGGEGHWA